MLDYCMFVLTFVLSNSAFHVQVSGCGKPRSHRHCPPFPSPWQPFWPQPLGLSSGRCYPRHRGLKSISRKVRQVNRINGMKRNTYTKKTANMDASG